jgi:hypothetical protein
VSQPKSKDDALNEYPLSLELRFKTEEDRQEFIGRYLDGNGEQSIDCYTASVTRDGTWNNKTEEGYTEASWHWEQPMFFIDVTPDDERDF